MSRINLHSLQLLVSIAATKSFSKTALELNMTPSAVSKRITELEVRFGTPLALRQNTGIELTPAGEAVVRCAEDVTTRISAMSAEVASLLACQKGEVKIMTNTTGILLGLLEDLKQFRQSHTGVRITVSESTSPEVATAVRSNSVDIGVCVATDTARGLSAFPYRQTNLVAIVQKDSALAVRTAISVRDLDAYPMIWKPPIEIDRMENVADADGSVGLTMRSFEAVVKSVADNAGVAIVPRIALDRFDNSQIVAIPLDTSKNPFLLIVCHDSSRHNTPEVQHVIAWLRLRAELPLP